MVLGDVLGSPSLRFWGRFHKAEASAATRLSPPAPPSAFRGERGIGVLSGVTCQRSQEGGGDASFREAVVVVYLGVSHDVLHYLPGSKRETTCKDREGRKMSGNEAKKKKYEFQSCFSC